MRQQDQAHTAEVIIGVPQPWSLDPVKPIHEWLNHELPNYQSFLEHSLIGTSGQGTVELNATQSHVLQEPGNHDALYSWQSCTQL